MASRAMIPLERIERQIFLIRGQKVMLDRDLAELYGVPTKALNQAVRRNAERFPEDFIFQLTQEEANAWWEYKSSVRSRSQFVTLKRGQNVKYRPYAFTEHGILMLSSVLKSERAVQVNIAIMRTFVRLRQLLTSNGELARKLAADEEERDDTKLAGDHLLVETSLEIPKPTWKYRPVQPIDRSTKHFFRYFWDGSYRHYFLATGLEHDRATPIFLAQIAIVILERHADGKLSIVQDFKRHQWFVLLAKSRISDAAWERIQESTKEAKVNIIIRIKYSLYKSPGIRFRE